MKKKILHEITPLTPNDCFTLFSRQKTGFDFPIHYHEEYELNLIINAEKAKRIVGDHIGIIGKLELVLIGPNLSHAWFTNECRSRKIQEITIQFHKDMLEEKLLQRNQLSFIRNMFEKSAKGILFSTETAQRLESRIIGLVQKTGFDSVLELLSILHDLSTSRHSKTLSNLTNNHLPVNSHSRRTERVVDYIYKNYANEITLENVSKLAGMTEASFSRFIKKHTGKTFIDTVNDIRLGHASRMLIETTHSIAEIATYCGYNNISNFNRLFKKKKNCTPKEFRENFSGTRIFI